MPFPAMKFAAMILCAIATVAYADRTPPQGAKKISIRYNYKSFHSNQLHYELAWNGGSYIATGSNARKTIDARFVQALYAALTDLRETSADVSCISHTDDYPDLTVAIEGASPLIIRTRSNCHALIPWTIDRNGTHYAQFTGAIPSAIFALLKQIDATNWSEFPDAPDATTFGGAEVVDFGTYNPNWKQLAPEAVACARDFAANPTITELLNHRPVVAELRLGCKVADHCATISASTEFAWNDVIVTLSVPCESGKIVVPRDVVASIAELRTFIQSKPLQTLLRMTRQKNAPPPRIGGGPGNWVAHSQLDDGPTLSYTDATIHIWARGRERPSALRYLRQLGIDGRAFATRDSNDLFWITQVNVDLDGKVRPTGEHQKPQPPTKD